MPGQSQSALSFREYDTRLAAYVVVVRGEAVLLVRLSNGSGWSLPGGGVDLYEQVREAAVREVLEESGLVVELLHLLDVHSQAIEPADGKGTSARPLNRVSVFFAGRAIDGQLTPETGGSTNDARWFNWAELEHIPLADLAAYALRGLPASLQKEGTRHRH